MVIEDDSQLNIEISSLKINQCRSYDHANKSTYLILSANLNIDDNRRPRFTAQLLNMFRPILPWLSITN